MGCGPAAHLRSKHEWGSWRAKKVLSRVCEQRGYSGLDLPALTESVLVIVTVVGTMPYDAERIVPKGAAAGRICRPDRLMLLR
jgi:hypothetical protein